MGVAVGVVTRARDAPLGCNVSVRTTYETAVSGGSRRTGFPVLSIYIGGYCRI
jgi:hypothetical protein